LKPKFLALSTFNLQDVTVHVVNDCIYIGNTLVQMLESCCYPVCCFTEDLPVGSWQLLVCRKGLTVWQNTIGSGTKNVIEED